MNRRVVVEIDIAALVRNYKRIVSYISPLKILCVLKANAYGLGVRAYARALFDAGCHAFGVAEPYEAKELRSVLGDDADIQILSSVLPDEIEEMVALKIILPLTDLETAELISRAAQKQETIARVHLKIDSGMGRLGVRLSDAKETLEKIKKLPALSIEGVFSHCPMAYDPNDPFTAKQIEAFANFVESEKGFKCVHIAASDAINNFPQAARAPFTMVRTGINLHGSFDPNGRRALALEPVLTLRTRVAQVRALPAGTTLGYGRTYTLKKDSRIATISAGYADGLPLALSNRAFVLIGKVKCPIVGRISMDYTTVDVSNAGNVSAGDDVICLGTSGDNSITPDDWAAIKGTHSYDILTSLGSRVERKII